MNWYLFLGYAILWALIFAYIVFLHRKQRELEKELEVLSSEVRKG